MSLVAPPVLVLSDPLSHAQRCADYHREFNKAQESPTRSSLLVPVTFSRTSSFPRIRSRRSISKNSTFTRPTTKQAELNLDFTNCAVFLIYMIINSSGKISTSVEHIQYLLAQKAQIIGGPRNKDSDVFEDKDKIFVISDLVLYIIESIGEPFALFCFKSTRIYQDSFYFFV